MIMRTITLPRLQSRYAAATRLVEDGVELALIVDPEGAQLNSVIRRWSSAFAEQPGPWDDIYLGAKALQWSRVTDAQPQSSRAQQLASRVVELADRILPAVSDKPLVEELRRAVTDVLRSEPPVGRTLLRSIAELGDVPCAVVVSRRRDRETIRNWLGRQVPTMSCGDLRATDIEVDVVYVVGPPSFFPSSIVTAPIAEEVIFLMPSWLTDHAVKSSGLAHVAEGAIEIPVRQTGASSDLPDRVQADHGFEPTADWSLDQPDFETSAELVQARKVLLSGGRAIWLDDGESIRALSPDQPEGERVVYVEVGSVGPGDFLLLRDGPAEHGALYEAALRHLDAQATAVAVTQSAWKSALKKRIDSAGDEAASEALRAMGVSAFNRVPSWASQELIRPMRDRDFRLLLEWLDLEIEPAFEHARLLRNAFYAASRDVRAQLEQAVAEADLAHLESEGHLRIDCGIEGVRAIVASEVLAISSERVKVPSHLVREPFEDGDGKWLD